MFSHAGITRTAISAHMGRSLKIRDALKSVRPRFWRYVWLLILQMTFAALIPAMVAGAAVAILAYFGFRAESDSAMDWGTGIFAVLLVLAALVYIAWRALGYSLAMAACVAEDKTAWESLNRAWKLSKGTRSRIFLMALLVWALSIVLSLIAYIPIVMVVATVSAIGHEAEYANGYRYRGRDSQLPHQLHSPDPDHSPDGPKSSIQQRTTSRLLGWPIAIFFGHPDIRVHELPIAGHPGAVLTRRWP